MSKDKKLQFNRIWAKGGKAKQTLLQKVAVRGLDTTEKMCFEYYMGWIKPHVVSKFGHVEWKNTYWEMFRKRNKFNNVRRNKKRTKGFNKKKN